MSEEIFHHKQIENNGDIIEINVLKVPITKQHPEGVVYSLAYLRNGKRLIGYDNSKGHEKEGSYHHKHIKDRVVHYDFIDYWKVIEDFYEDIEKIRRGVIK